MSQLRRRDREELEAELEQLTSTQQQEEQGPVEEEEEEVDPL